MAETALDFGTPPPPSSSRVSFKGCESSDNKDQKGDPESESGRTYRTRVAFVSSGFFPNFDGVSVSVSRRIEMLLQTEDYEVLLVVPSYDNFPDTYKTRPSDYLNHPRLEIVEVSSWRLPPFPTELVWCRSGIKMAKMAVEAFRPSIVFVEEPERVGLVSDEQEPFSFDKTPTIGVYHTRFSHYAAEGHFTAGIPCTGCLSRILAKYIKSWVSKCYNSFETVVFQNENLRQTLEQEEGIDSRRLHRLKLHGIDNSLFYPGNSSLLESNPGTIKVLWVSRIESEKGWVFFLEQIDDLKMALARYKWKFHVVGDGTLCNEVARTLEEKLGRDLFEMYGSVKHKLVAKYMQAADLFVTCSDTETFGLTTLEAMACGLPVIAPACPCNELMVRHEETGLLYDPDEDGSLAHCCQRLVADTVLRCKLGNGAFLLAQEYSQDRIREEFVDFIQEKCSANE